uniref:Uncharacterized protein n=1 Tax=Amphimedon queenslandica TaxID=400682 RepID=A0A1X7T310_AMPQE
MLSLSNHYRQNLQFIYIVCHFLWLIGLGGVKRSSSEKTPKKKDSPSLIRRKPMITESDSDDDFVPLPTKKPPVTVKPEPPATPVKNDVPPRLPVDVKIEFDVATPPKPPAVDREVKVKAG